ncbi:MAG: pentapeptide repeat-containing protein [Oscillatoriophycideae cyanobacterium NC_groundwater_1537_Pr4_S-0.65um_50_18]|nr:pentapeptide repeat-containing protein [Oscillatoriophycideae cyanobacterium NC_groundwater_1537_Pr4_S-0.65um_50_18]
MKNARKEEVVWLYELGERSFKRQNLRGKCFRGENLSGVDFSGSDIRGADFTNSILRDALFVNVTAGLQKRQATILLGLLFLFAVLLGLAAGVIGAFAEIRFFSVQPTEQFGYGWITPIVIIGFTFVALTRSMAMGFGIFALAFLTATSLAIVSSSAIPVAGGIALLIIVNALVASATAAMSALMVAAVLAFRITVALMLAATFIGAFGLVIILTETFAATSSISSAITVAAIVLPLSAYIGWRTLKGDRKHTLTWLIANFLSTKWGTSFRGADLTNADFSRAVLQSTDFGRSNVTNTCWDKCTWTGNSLN